MASGRADRRPRLDPVAIEHRDVHEQIERRRRFGCRKPEFPHRGGEIVGAIVVIPLGPEQLVAPAVASGKQRVMDPARIILDERQDRSPPVRHERVADSRDDPAHRNAAVLHRHEFAEVRRVECPGVDDLLPLAVDDPRLLPAPQMQRFPPPRRYLDHLCLLDSVVIPGRPAPTQSFGNYAQSSWPGLTRPSTKETRGSPGRARGIKGSADRTTNFTTSESSIYA